VCWLFGRSEGLPNPKNHTHVQQAIHLSGGVYLGFQVQENCIQEFDAGKPWTPGTLTADGHAVFAVGYDQDGVTVLTWGNIQQGTWAWWDEVRR
jgi:C1A family cysteine protease